MPEDTFEQRVALRRATMTARLVHSHEAADRVSEELERMIEPSKRAEAIWGLTCELARLQGLDESELRLDRSVARLERRKR